MNLRYFERFFKNVIFSQIAESCFNKAFQLVEDVDNEEDVSLMKQIHSTFGSLDTVILVVGLLVTLLTALLLRWGAKVFSTRRMCCFGDECSSSVTDERPVALPRLDLSSRELMVDQRCPQPVDLVRRLS